MTPDDQDRADLLRFQVQDGASIGLRLVAFAILAALTIREGGLGFVVGMVGLVFAGSIRPTLTPRIVSRAEAALREDVPRPDPRRYFE